MDNRIIKWIENAAGLPFETLTDEGMHVLYPWQGQMSQRTACLLKG